MKFQGISCLTLDPRWRESYSLFIAACVLLEMVVIHLSFSPLLPALSSIVVLILPSHSNFSSSSHLRFYLLSLWFHGMVRKFLLVPYFDYFSHCELENESEWHKTCTHSRHAGGYMSCMAPLSTFLSDGTISESWPWYSLYVGMLLTHP